MKFIFGKIIALVLAIAVMLPLANCAGEIKGCQKTGSSDSNEIEYVVPVGFDEKDGELSDEGKAFNDFLLDLFKSEVTADTITLHYTLKDPSAYGIEMDGVTFGTEETEGEGGSVQDLYDELIAFDFDKLCFSQQISYEVLKLRLELIMEETEDIAYFGSYLDYLSGIQSNLPITLAEYKFYNESDVKDYLALLELVPDYFDNIIAYEQERIDLGLGLSDAVLDMAKKQCEDFIKITDKNYLILTFDSRVSALGLSESVVTQYKTEDKNLVLNSVITAYQTLIDAIDGFKGKGTNDLGLYSFEKGKDYYEYLVKYKTGSSLTVNEMITMLNRDMYDVYNLFSKTAQNNSGAYSMYSSGNYTYAVTEPEDILNYLIDAISEEYPTPVSKSFTIKDVEKALEDSLSPAFYMIPPIDDYMDNVIYINNGQVDDTGLFSTLAHEGYPGHLYQTTYFNAINDYEIRGLLNFNGYAEGWAVYSELHSYDLYTFKNNNDALTTLLQCNTKLGLNLSCRIDIGVNYENWTVADVASYLEAKGFNKEAANQIFDIVLASPGTYLQYYIGYLEIANLKDYAKEQLGSRFSELGFNTTILNAGPCQFDVLEKLVKVYVSDCNAFFEAA